MPRSLEETRSIAVIGGGRWARVFLTVLADMDPPYRLIVVSTLNADRIVGLADRIGTNLLLVPTLDHLLRQYRVTAAVVANAARLHAETALRLVEAGASVLIEKPLALSKTDVARLYTGAAENGVYVAPSLTFHHCSYLCRFVQKVGEYGAPPASIRLEWQDPATEIRYGEEKNFDPGISIAQDVMPHVWAILTSVLRKPDVHMDVQSCAIERGGRRAEFVLSNSGIRCIIVLEREAHTRRRFLELELASGSKLTLDFTIEPGVIETGSDSSSGDPDWDQAPRPVRRQLQAFLTLLEQRPDEKLSRRAAMASVSLCEDSDLLLKQEQRSWLGGCPLTRIDDDVGYAVGELTSVKLYETKQIRPGDRTGFQRCTRDIVQRLRSAKRVGNWRSALESLA